MKPPVAAAARLAPRAALQKRRRDTRSVPRVTAVESKAQRTQEALMARFASQRRQVDSAPEAEARRSAAPEAAFHPPLASRSAAVGGQALPPKRMAELLARPFQPEAPRAARSAAEALDLDPPPASPSAPPSSAARGPALWCSARPHGAFFFAHAPVWWEGQAAAHRLHRPSPTESATPRDSRSTRCFSVVAADRSRGGRAASGAGTMHNPFRFENAKAGPPRGASSRSQTTAPPPAKARGRRPPARR